jgi:hypothetical protein
LKLNGHFLDKNHTFSSCTVSDYERITGESEQQEKNKQADYLEINAQVLETKKNQYGIQTGKKLVIKSLMGQTKVLHNLDESQK